MGETNANTLENTVVYLLKDATSLTILNCNYLDIKPYAIFDMNGLRSLKISNISHLSIEKNGLSVSQHVPLKISISNSSCDDYPPKFSAQNSYKRVILQGVKVLQNCTCEHDSTNYLCQIHNTSTGNIEFQKYEKFDESNCDHSDHHHSIFEEILTDNKYILIGNKQV